MLINILLVAALCMAIQGAGFRSAQGASAQKSESFSDRLADRAFASEAASLVFLTAALLTYFI